MVHIGTRTVNVYTPTILNEDERKEVLRAIDLFDLDDAITIWVKDKTGIDVKAKSSRP